MERQLEPTGTISETVESTNRPRWVQIAFWLCVVVAIAVVIRRLVALAHPSPAGPPQLVALDAVFAVHAQLTLAHIISALFFVLLLPVFYSQRFAGRLWTRYSIYVLGVMVGISAYVMSRYSVGGWVERSAVLLFNSLFLFSLLRSYWYFRSRRLSLEQAWMTRAVAILLGIATTRPVMGVFFATAPFTHLEPSQFFGIAFWIGFSINTIAVELWLRSRAETLT